MEIAQNKEYIEKLASFGLNDVESKIYLHLVHNEPKTFLEISKALSIPRTSIYDNSEKLIEKGLLERIVNFKSQKLKAYPIDHLGNIVDKEKEKVEKMQDVLETFKSDINFSSLKTSSFTEVRYYSGAEGLRQIMWNTLKAKTEMYGYSIMGRMEVVGEKFMQKYVDEFKKRKLKDRVIVNPVEFTLNYVGIFADTSKSQLAFENIRYIDKDRMYIAGDTTIYNDTFALCFWKEGEVVGVEIDNPEFVKTQKSIFELLWEVAKPVEELIESR
jgi:sugar-specific transcriptional regulator TrmB